MPASTSSASTSAPPAIPWQAARRAVGIIPTVTVEIPAVPEDAGRLRELLPAMADAGIAHLNLHQLRLTPYNIQRLAGRPFTDLHGNKRPVLETELAALELLAWSLEAASICR